MDKERIEIEGMAFNAAEPQQDGYCYGCAFYEGMDELCFFACRIQACVPAGREDRKHIIWIRA